MRLPALHACIGRRFLTTAVAGSAWSRPPVLTDADVETFRTHAFEPALPHLFPLGMFADLPATKQWFRSNSSTDFYSLDVSYLSRFGSAIVPLEISSRAGARETNASQVTSQHAFQRSDYPLSVFLDFLDRVGSRPRGSVAGEEELPSVYLAQCPLSSLPSEMRADVPTPAFVTKAGRGDIYDSSIWIGLAPTHTPLHKDPNPNLFAQLAGRKIIRIFEPAVGTEIFSNVQRRLRAHGAAAIRGEEMMVGPERTLLDEAVWNDEMGALGYEAVLNAGDAIFVPKGWWHSVKGVGDGVVGSVNWWFR